MQLFTSLTVEGLTDNRWAAAYIPECIRPLNHMADNIYLVISRDTIQFLAHPFEGKIHPVTLNIHSQILYLNAYSWHVTKIISISTTLSNTTSMLLEESCISAVYQQSKPMQNAARKKHDYLALTLQALQNAL